MDEKYIQTLYNSLGGQAKFGKYEDFRDLISNNEDYRKQFHSTFGEKQLGAYNDFNDLVSVKKKDTGTNFSQIGTLAGNTGSETQSTKSQNEQGINQDDPIGSYQDRFIKQHDNLSQQLRQQQTPFAQDATAKRNVLPADASLNKVNNFLTTIGQLSENKKQFQSVRDDAKKYMDALPSSEAKKYVQERVQKDNPNAPDVLNINTEDIRNLPSFKGNVTANMMLDKVDNYKNVLKAGDGALNIEDWARNFAASNNPELYKVLSKPIPDNQQAHFSVSGQLPGTTQNNKKEKSIASGITYGKDAATGTSVYELLSNPAAQEISQSNPELHQQFQHAYDNLFQTYPSLGRKILGEQIGKYREENGKNNILYNSTDGNDKIVEELVNKGQLPPSSLQFYNANKSAIHVPTSDIVSNLFHGIDVGVKGGLSSISDIYTSGKQATKEATENKYTQQSFTPKGTLHELTTTIPEFTGQILPIALLSKGLGSAGVSPRIASAISMGTMFEHNNRQRGAELFPNNTGMQQLYSTISTGADMLIGAAYDRAKAISFLKKEVKPEISDVLKKLDGGEINEIAAKGAIKGTVNNAFDKIKNFGGEAIKQNVEQSAQIGGFTLAHDIVDAAFGQKLDLNKSLDKSLESAKNAFISGSALSLLAAAGQTNPAMKVAADQVYDMVKNYDKTRDAINNDIHLSDAEKEERVTNLDHAKLILNDVENNLDLTDKQKKRYLLQSLNEKVLQDKIDNTTDSVLKNKYKEQIKISQEARENIIGEKPVEKQVQGEQTPSPQQDRQSLVDEATKSADDITGVYKSVFLDNPEQVMKEAAQQLNSSPDEARVARATFGDKISDIALKLFPDAKVESTNPEADTNNQQGNISTEEKKPTEQSVSENVQQPEKSDFDHFKEQMLSELENRSKDKFDLKINHELLPVEQKTIEQGIKNIREGKDTKAAQQVEAAIKKMYDDGVVHYEAKSGKIHTQQPQGIPASHFIEISKEANKPIDINNDDHLHELNMLLGEDAFPHVVNEESANFINEKNGTSSENDTSKENIQQPSTRKPAENNKEITGDEGSIPPQQSGAADATEGNNVTGVKRAVTDPLRESRELPKVEIPKMGTDKTELQNAKNRVDSGESNPRDLVERILTKNDGYHNENDVWDMQYYAHQLDAKEKELRQQHKDAETGAEKLDITGKLQQLSDEIDRQTEAAQIAGNKWHKIGMSMQPVIDNGFNPAREKLFIKDAYNGEIPKEVQQKLDNTIKERDEAIKQRDEAEEKLKKAQAEQFVKESKGQRTPKSKGDYKQKRSDLLDDLKKAKDDHDKWMRDNGIEKSGISFSLTPKMIKIIGSLAKTYIDEGLEKVEEIISKVHGDIKDLFEGISKNDVRNAIATYHAEKLETKSKGLEDKVATGKVEPTPTLKLKFQKNTDWVKANQKVINAEYKIKQMKRQAFESQKNLYQKGLMWLSRGVRLSILSGYNVLAKLAAAATIGGAIKRIPEQSIGAMWSGVFKGISGKAPIEGGLNINSEIKFYKEFFNPQKFAHNSFEILKTGASDLTKKMGNAEYEHIPILYLPTDLHQIIKDPLKRATFEASFNNGLKWADKNGLDIHDPLVVQSIEVAAYKRANYEIFQEQSWLTKKFNEYKTKMDKAGNVGSTGKFLADFLVPISTVPTNIVKRLASTSPIGLIRGGVKVIQAYRKGIENLNTEEADAVIRQLKQGTLGTALWLIGWFGANSLGGLYTKYNPDKKRQDGEFTSNQMEVGGEMIPKPVQHALPLEIMQLAATLRHTYDAYARKNQNSTFTDIEYAALSAIGAAAEQIPVVETGYHMAASLKDPYEGNKLGEDMKRRFEPQILKETGIIQDKKPEMVRGGKSEKPHKSHAN